MTTLQLPTRYRLLELFRFYFAVSAIAAVGFFIFYQLFAVMRFVVALGSSSYVTRPAVIALLSGIAAAAALDFLVRRYLEINRALEIEYAALASVVTISALKVLADRSYSAILFDTQYESLAAVLSSFALGTSGFLTWSWMLRHFLRSHREKRHKKQRSD